MFLKKEAKKRNFKRKEEKEEKEAEWDASSTHIQSFSQKCIIKSEKQSCFHSKIITELLIPELLMG